MMKLCVVLFLFVYVVSAEVYFKETFDSTWEDRWVVSDHKKSDGTAGKWKLTSGDWYGDKIEDQGIMTSQDARFYAISSMADKSFSNKDKDLVVQFSVKHTQKIDCGGGYIKILPSTADQKTFNGDTPYAIMFGPDICGTSTRRVHVIFNYKEKNLLIKEDVRCETDQLTHVYTLILRSDNTYDVRIDNKSVKAGNLEDDWDFLPAKRIKDPSQSKPADWVDAAKIPDPEAVKPEGWDDIPEQIEDPSATEPEDWDSESDGDWEAPMIPNPEYKGVWQAPLIDNPDYQGEWIHPEIDNPEYAPDANLYLHEDMQAVGIEIWQVKSGTIFDNIIITDSVEEAEEFLAETYEASKENEKAMLDKIETQKREQEAAERKEREAQEAAQHADSEEDEDDEDDYEDAPKPKDEL